MVRYPDTGEEIDSNHLPPKHKPLPLETHCDSNLAYERVTRRSAVGVFGMEGKIAIIHQPKR